MMSLGRGSGCECAACKVVVPGGPLVAQVVCLARLLIAIAAACPPAAAAFPRGAEVSKALGRLHWPDLSARAALRVLLIAARAKRRPEQLGLPAPRRQGIDPSRGLTCEELARVYRDRTRNPMTEKTIAKLENGCFKRLPVAQLRHIADILAIDEVELISLAAAVCLEVAKLSWSRWCATLPASEARARLSQVA